MSIAKKPYKITLWGDDSIYIIQDRDGRKEVTDLNLANGSYTILNHNYREVPLVTIGSDTMDTPVRAFNPKLTRELNGSNTLTFEMYYRYYDDSDDTYKMNPFISLLVNERKVKLFYDNEWYDMVVKQIQENSTEYTFTYTCTDQYINELAKAGYEIEMDVELENNMGTVVELGDYILDGSDWRVDKDDCDLIKQKNVENLFAYTLRSSLRATVMDDYRFIDNLTDEEMAKGTTYTIPAGQTIWVCYSSIINEDEQIQFFWRNRTSLEDDYIVDEDGVIMNSPNWQAARPTSGFSLENMEASDVYFGNMLVSKQKTIYVQQIDKYCTIWRKNGARYYCYQDTEYASIAEIQQMLTNGNNFTSTFGWEGKGDTTVSLSQITQNGQFVPTLRCAFKFSSPEIRNSGFYDHRAQTNGFAPGDKYIFAVKTSPAGRISRAAIVGAPMDAPYGTGETTFVNFARTTAHIPSSLTGYDVFLGTCQTSLSYEEMLRYTLDFCAYGQSGVTIELIDAKLFKYAIGKNGYIIVPDMENTMNSVVKVRYNFFSPQNLNGVTNVNNLRLSEVCYDGDSALAAYTPEKDEAFEKIRSITGSKSNRFNLIQELCETFECWAKFTIEHFPDGTPRFAYQLTEDATPVPGKIYYKKAYSQAGEFGNQYSNDYNFNEYVYPDGASFSGVNYERHIMKWVSFKEFIGQENWAGFKYGINLKGIQRTIDSNQLVSKMIVQPNANEYAENGSCTIQYATMNPTLETAMFNFNYFVQNGLLSRRDLNRDLFGDSDGGMAYFAKLHQMNQRLQPDIYELGEIANTLISLIARQQVYTALVEEAKANYQEYITDIANWLGISPSSAATIKRDSSKYNDVLNSYITKRDTANTIINQYSQIVTDTDTLVNEYQSAYNRLSDSLKVLADQKEALNKMFYSKYSRFIHEGTWISEDYIDADLYYMDAVEVLRQSAYPKLTYTIDVLELSQVEGFEPYTFHIGDKTYMEDVEFFGYNTNGSPYREEIVVSKVLYHLDDPSQNVITVQNYKTQFEDLFQRITASTTSLQYAEGVYNRAGSAVNPDGTLNSEFLKNSLEKNVGLIMGAPNGELIIDQDKGCITATSGRGDLLINSLGILVGTGGNYQTAISAEGINASVITTGRLNTGEVFIYADGQETFRWDAYGLSAYAFDMTSQGVVTNVNFNKFVRMDRFGLYGIVNKTNYKPTSVDQVVQDAMFSLTWRGLSINIDTQTPDVINVNDKFVVDGQGNVTAKNGTFHGRIEAEEGYFNGTVHATDGDFTGIIKAQDIQLKNGSYYQSILTPQNQISGDWINARGITVRNNSGAITFQVNGYNGEVTVNGAIKMGSGSSIDWSVTDESNIWYSETYQKASDAELLADKAKDTADNALSAANEVNEDFLNLVRGTYYNRTATFINGKEIYSPTIMGNNIVVDGHFQVYNGNCITGYIGAAYGSVGNGIKTNGVAMCASGGIITSLSWDPYVIVTTEGCRMTAGDCCMFVTYSDVWVNDGSGNNNLGSYIENKIKQLLPSK